MINYAEYSEEDKLRIQKFPWYYLHLPDLPLDLVMEALRDYPGFYSEITNPTREIVLYLVSNHGHYLNLVDVIDQDEEICIEAIKNHPYTIRNVKIGITEEMCREYVLSFLNSRGKIYDVEWIGKALAYLPEEILLRESFRKFLIDNGIFGFLRLVK